MPSYWFAFTMSVLVAASLARPEVDIYASMVSTLSLVLAWGVLAKTAAWHAALAVRRDPSELVAIENEFYRHLAIIRWSWIPASFLAIAIFGWGTFVTQIAGQLTSGRQVSVTLQALLLLLPGLSVAAISWGCEFQWGKWLDEHFRTHHWQTKALLSFLWDSFRLQACWLLLPLLFVLVAWDVLLFAETQGLAPSSLGPLLVLLVPLLLPLTMRMAWRTRPLQEPWLTRLLTTAGLPRLAVRYWETEMRLSTAVVIGILPFARMLVISDRLASQLTRSELAMVVLHELAHIKRFHLILRVASLVPLWTVVTCAYCLGENHPLIHDWWMQGAVLATGGLLTLLTLRQISYLTEFDADATACRLAVSLSGRIEDLPNNIPWAAREMCSALIRITGGDPNSHNGTWMHPKLSSRIARLNGLNAPEFTSATCPHSVC